MRMRYLFLFFLLFLNIPLNSVFEFVDNKINRGALDKRFIQTIVQEFGIDIFFETGTYTAATTLNAAPFFKKLYTVELHDQLFNQAKQKLAHCSNVNIFHASSPEIIKQIGPTINGTVLFWLDAHYSGEGTALSYNNPFAADAITAIRAELSAIKDCNIKDCVILIDDIRGFGIEILSQDYLCCWAYPTTKQVERDLLKINPNFKFALLGDQFLAYDGNKYHPVFSETVKACTASLLYDGYNLTDGELIEVEKKIMQAPPNEKAYIIELYNLMTQYNAAMFLHDLWYGLVQLNAGNAVEAKKAFTKIKIRTDHVINDGKFDPRTIYYDHPRIDKYIERCNS